MRLTHYINRKSWDTFVGEATLAKDCHVSVRAVERALKAARDLGIIKRTVRGNQYVGPSHYVFQVSAPDTCDQCTRHLGPSAPDTCVNLTSDKHLNNLTSMEEGNGSSERAPAGLKSEPKTRWTKPIIYGERLRTSEDSFELEQIREAGFVPRVWWRPAA